MTLGYADTERLIWVGLGAALLTVILCASAFVGIRAAAADLVAARRPTLPRGRDLVLGRTSADRLGSMTYLIAPLAVVLGSAILGEVPPLLAITGVLSILGVIVARSHGRR